MILYYILIFINTAIFLNKWKKVWLYVEHIYFSRLFNSRSINMFSNDNNMYVFFEKLPKIDVKKLILIR